MSFLNTKKALIQRLLDNLPPQISPDHIYYENDELDPTGIDNWLACYFIPATSESLGKTIASSDQCEGIFQISIFTKANAGVYDNEQLAIADAIRLAFPYGSTTIYDSQTVHITETELAAGEGINSWLRRDLSVNYFSFSVRN